MADTKTAKPGLCRPTPHLADAFSGALGCLGTSPLGDVFTGSTGGRSARAAMRVCDFGCHGRPPFGRDEAGRALAKELRFFGSEAEFINADVRGEDDVRALVDARYQFALRDFANQPFRYDQELDGGNRDRRRVACAVAWHRC
jgi:hypothetical protein